MAFTIGEIGLDLVLNSKEFQSKLGGLNKQANLASERITSSFKKIGVAIATAFSAKMIASFSKQCVELADNQTEAETKLTTIMQQRMKATTQSIQKIKDYTSSQQQLGVVGDELQLAGSQQLATFLNTDKSLKTLIPAMNNLAVQQNGVNVTSGNMVEIGNLMGKVMQGQTSALTRVGISFDESQEKVLKYGNEQERAAMLSQVITDNVGEMNKALANTPAGQMQKLKNSFGDLKESIGRSLQNVFVPLLKYLNSALATLSKVSSKFEEISQKLFGVSSNVSGSLNDSASSADNLADGVNDSSTALDNVADSAEKAKRSIAGFDKLNVISKDTTNSINSNDKTSSNKNNGLSSSISNSLNKLSTNWATKGQKVIDSMKRSFNSLKSVVKSIGESWQTVWNNGSGKKLVNNIKTLLSNCFDIIGNIADAFTKAWKKGNLGNQVVQSIIDKWNSLIELINKIADDFKKVWNDGTGERIWGNILEIIRNCNNYVSVFRDKLKQAWNKNETGKKLWKDILGIVEDVTGFIKNLSKIRLDWMKTLDLSPLMKGVEQLAGAFRGLLKVCGDKLKTAYKNILLPLAKWTIEKAVPKLVETLANALKLVSNIIKNISPSVLNAIAGGITAIGTSVIVFKSGMAIANGIEKVKTALKILLCTLEAHPLIALASAVGGLILAVTTYNQLQWSSSEAGKFADSIDNIKSQLESTTQEIQDNFKNTLNNIDDMYADNTLVDSYQAKLDELINKATLTPAEQSQLQTIVTYFSNNVDGFSTTWNNYVTISKDGKINLKGDLTDIQNEIDNTINSYQKLANQSALSDMQTDNSKEQIKAKKDLSNALNKVVEKQKKVSSEEEKYNKWLKDNNYTKEHFENLYNSNPTSARNDALTKQGAQYYENIKSYTKSLDEVKNEYNKTTGSVNELIMVGDDLSDVQKVLNGDYTDAAAVMMAYNEGMISQNDILSATDDNGKRIWKSMDDVSKKAKESGKNTVLGLVKGTQEYQDALVKNSNGLASIVISEYRETMGIHSPSQVMYDNGQLTVEGLVNGIGKTTNKLTPKLKTMVDLIKEKIDPVKNAFKNVFGGIWSIIKDPINKLMEHIEKFINGFISGINCMLSKVDWAVNSVGQIFGQEWHSGQLGKVQLPRFAKGAIVSAPTLAVVGDNAGANSGNPEVIAPLNKLQGMMNTSSGEDTVILKAILDYLKRIYEMFVIFRNNGGNMYEFVANINGTVMFNEVIKQNDLYKKRHNGQSAFV